jgi:aminopeptidase N
LVSLVESSPEAVRAPANVAPTAARSLRLEQSRFTVNDPAARPLTWKVPVTLANTADLASVSVTLLEKAPVTVPWPAGSGTIKANVGNTGFYRVLYDDGLTDALQRTAPTLPVNDQLNLLGDTWALTEAGRTSATTWLGLVEQLRESPSQPVWEHVIDKLELIDRYQWGQPGRRAFQAWAVQLLAPRFAALGWQARPGESPLDASLRPKLITALGTYGDRVTIDECTRRFQAFVADPASLPGNLRGAVLGVVGRYATRETYDQLHALARGATTTEEKRRAYAAMQAALDPVLARRTLELTLGDELSTTEAARNVAAVAAKEHADLAWEFASANTEALLKRTTFFGRNVYLPGIARVSTDAPRADELEKLVREKLPPAALAEAAKGADLIRLNALVKKRELPAIDGWIKQRVKLPE